MAARTMDSYVTKGKSDVQDRLTEGVSDISKMGDEYRGVRDQLQNMPGGLDADLLAMIKDAENQGREEATRDIEATKRAVIDTAKQSADQIQSDVNSKINDNNTARRTLEGISSKYGRDAINQAKTSIEGNTKMGQDLLKTLETAVRNADQSVQSVKDSL